PKRQFHKLLKLFRARSLARQINSDTNSAVHLLHRLFVSLYIIMQRHYRWLVSLVFVLSGCATSPPYFEYNALFEKARFGDIYCVRNVLGYSVFNK
ncbi:MAG: hypothetical protein WCH01_06930, partial [Methylococcaceae bacterium]